MVAGNLRPALASGDLASGEVSTRPAPVDAQGQPAAVPRVAPATAPAAPVSRSARSNTSRQRSNPQPALTALPEVPVSVVDVATAARTRAPKRPASVKMAGVRVWPPPWRQGVAAA
jgi:hypothetical protein